MSTAAPAVPLRDDALVHELDRADVEAAGRLAGQQQLDVPAHLAGHDDLLLVAAGQRPGRRLHGRGPHVVLLHPAWPPYSRIASRFSAMPEANGGRS